jgi:tripartite-type tricarboxylate transporter receptor subunit TctC
MPQQPAFRPARRTLVRAAVGAALATLAAGAAAQAWPARTISMYVGSPPGSAPDAYARAAAEQMSKLLGQQVIVETKTGANGNIAAEFTVRQPADGHHIWVAAQSQAEVNPSAYDDLRWKPADFTGIIKGAQAPLLLVAHPSTGVKTVAELAAWLKANPSKASYGSFGGGTVSQFLGYQLAERFKLELTHVPFNGSGPQVQNLVGGHVPMGFTQIQTGLPHVRDGRLNALATSGATRWRQLPDVPILAELGWNEMVAVTWFGLFVRANTPPDIVAKLTDVAVKAHADAGMRQRLDSMGLDVPNEHGPAFDAAVQAGRRQWAGIVKATGFKATQ